MLERTFTAGLDGPTQGRLHAGPRHRGGIELDGTVTRLAADRFLVVIPAAAEDKTLSILRRAAAGHAAAVFDGPRHATIAVMGPFRASSCTGVTGRLVGRGPALHLRPHPQVADGYAFMLRVSFVGELGYSCTRPPTWP